MKKLYGFVSVIVYDFLCTNDSYLEIAALKGNVAEKYNFNQEIVNKTVNELETSEQNMIPFDLSDKKVLIVDDNKINLKVAERLMRDYKVSIDLVISGSECINKILDGKKYDLIFLDIMMPKMKGPEVLQNLKNIIGFNTPVVALTADVISGMEEKYISQGMLVPDDITIRIVEERLKDVFDRIYQQRVNFETSLSQVEDGRKRIYNETGCRIRKQIRL